VPQVNPTAQNTSETASSHIFAILFDIPLIPVFLYLLSNHLQNLIILHYQYFSLIDDLHMWVTEIVMKTVPCIVIIHRRAFMPLGLSHLTIVYGTPAL